MITASTIYWITRATPLVSIFANIIPIAILIMILVNIIYVFTVFCVLEDEEENQKKAHRVFMKINGFLISITIISTLGFIFIPNTPTLTAIQVLPKIAQNKDLQQIAPNAAKMINTQLERWVKDNLDNLTKGETK